MHVFIHAHKTDRQSLMSFQSSEFIEIYIINSLFHEMHKTQQSDLDPMVWCNVGDVNCGFRLVQQNLHLGAARVLTGADADGNHPIGAVLI